MASLKRVLFLCPSLVTIHLVTINLRFTRKYSILFVQQANILFYKLRSDLYCCFITDKSISPDMLMFDMSKDSEIPCSSCNKWNQKTNSFSCNPHKCQQLSEWLITYTKIRPLENILVIPPQIQYIV